MIDETTFGNLVAYVLQSSALVGAALAAIWVLRIDPASVRYGLLRATLVLALALPVLQPRVVIQFPVSSTEEIGAAAQRDRAAGERGSARQPLSSRASMIESRLWMPALAIVLAGGVFGRLGWLLAGLWRLQKLRGAGETAAGDEHSDLQRVIGTTAELRYVSGLEQPLTFGFRRPVVLLPGGLRQMTPPIQRAVVAHELWHVRRFDWVWTVAEEAVRSALWFHPALWVLLSRIQLAREETVDDLAVLTIGSRRSYLDALLAFADARPIFPSAAFARRRHLLHRMLTISKETAMSSQRLVASCAALMCIGIITAWSAATAFPLTTTQAPPRDPRKPVEAPTVKHEMIFVPATEETLREDIKRDPTNAEFYRLLAGIYLKAGDFDRAVATLEALAQADPSKPQHHQAVGVFYWEKANRDANLTREQKLSYIESGIDAIDRALSLDPDYVDALVYKNILLRLQAAQTRDVGAQQQLIAAADILRARAMELAKQRPPQSARRDRSMPPPPPPPSPSYLSPVDGVMPVRVGGDVRTPIKIKDVRPVYPPEAQAARMGGMVIIEAVIDATGVVRHARVLRSLPILDDAALDAVRQWQFTPTVIEGVPRPVVMTVTVNFTLQ